MLLPFITKTVSFVYVVFPIVILVIFVSLAVNVVSFVVIFTLSLANPDEFSADRIISFGVPPPPLLNVLSRSIMLIDRSA